MNLTLNSKIGRMKASRAKMIERVKGNVLSGNAKAFAEDVK